ncbi:MAG TPA: cupredoxin domain-containing protein [Anaerolineae bacterium]|nr:cupredoxin domain-containing protein [Anaerolineae bacterium]
MFGRKSLLFASVVLVIAAIISACGGGGGNTNPDNTSGGQTVMVQGSEFEYQPNVINAKPGEKVNVQFKNTGTVEHTFVIKDLNFKIVAEPGQTVTKSFTAPSSSGSFEIHCDVAGHTEAGMKGTLNVVAANN